MRKLTDRFNSRIFIFVFVFPVKKFFFYRSIESNLIRTHTANVLQYMSNYTYSCRYRSHNYYFLFFFFEPYFVFSHLLLSSVCIFAFVSLGQLFQLIIYDNNNNNNKNSSHIHRCKILKISHLDLDFFKLTLFYGYIYRFAQSNSHPFSFRRVINNDIIIIIIQNRQIFGFFFQLKYTV